ncbi:MAG: SymE family type I addiction module toxin [Lachnospira sp.]|nr:SymE family type I addiction module toxin [Lachnospira sp.]
MKEKELKIYEAPGQKRNIPRILLQGDWLSQIGFHTGDHIKVTYQDNRIIVESSPDTTSTLSQSN